MNIIDNWKLVIKYDNGYHGINPHLVNVELNLAIPIPTESLYVFGYRVAGPELGTIKHNTEGTKDEKIIELVKIISSSLVHVKMEPKYWDVRNFLLEYKGKMKFGKFIEASKSTINAIHKTLDIMNDEFQNICKYTELKRDSDENRYL